MTRADILRLIRDKVHHPATARELTAAARPARGARQLQASPRRRSSPTASCCRSAATASGCPRRWIWSSGASRPTRPASASSCRSTHGQGERQDIYIAASNLTEAMHGDRVVARVERQHREGLEGRIIRILERSQETIVGRFEVDDAGLGYVVPFDRRVLTDVHVPTGQWSSAEPGEMVLVEITRWPTATRGPVGRVVEVLGHDRRAGRGHADHHPQVRDSRRALRGRRRGGAAPRRRRSRSATSRGRTDFRGMTTVTIDGEHARDFDDAITIERLAERQLLAGRAHRGRRRTTSRRGARSTRRPTSAARRCTSPSGPCTCFRRSSPRDCAASTRTSIGWCSRA